MKKKTVAGMVVATVVAVTAVQLSGQKASAVTGDFRNAATAEVHNEHGQVLLRGSFAVVDNDDKGEVERHAQLAPMVAGSSAKGVAEVEYQVEDPSKQELELTATGVTAGSQVVFVIDGTKVATATADKNGKVDIEFEARSAAAQ